MRVQRYGNKAAYLLFSSINLHLTFILILMRYLPILLLFILPFSSQAQSSKKEKNPREFTAPDGTVVKQYFFVMLTAGPKRNEINDTAVLNRIQQGHMDNIKRLGKAGKLAVAGPFGDEGTWIGLFIFNCDTKEEVEKLLQTDPAIAAGRLAYEIHPWWTGKNEVFK